MSLQKTGFDGVLDGVRIIDLSRGFAGAFCGHALAQLGASVLAVRPPDSGLSGQDLERLQALDSSKTIELLDCYNPKNFDRVSAMCEGAALIIEERPGQGWPMGQPLAAQLMTEKSSLTAICISPFGLCGPHANFVAEPLTTYHSAGHAQQIPCDPLWPEYKTRSPLQAGAYWGESQSGLIAAVAALAIVTGNGCWKGHIIDCSKQEALLQMHWTELVRYPNSGKVIDRLEPNTTFIGGILPAADGYVQIVALEQHQWEGLVKLLNQPPWMMSADYSTQSMRVARWTEVSELLAAETEKRAKQDLYVEGQALGVPIAPIMSMAELKCDMGLRERGVFGPANTVRGSVPRWDGSVFINDEG